MITILSVANFSLPLEDPVLKFLVVLIIILFAPILLNKIKVPHLLGLINFKALHTQQRQGLTVKHFGAQAQPPGAL